MSQSLREEIIQCIQEHEDALPERTKDELADAIIAKIQERTPPLEEEAKNKLANDMQYNLSALRNLRSPSQLPMADLTMIDWCIDYILSHFSAPKIDVENYVKKSDGQSFVSNWKQVAHAISERINQGCSKVE